MLIKPKPKPKPKKPRKPTLSPTKISTYLACRLKYKFTYIDKIARFYYKPKSYHSFGASLHRALEDFHKAGGAETQSPDQLVEKLHTAWTSQGYQSPEEEQEKLSDASEFLEQYHAQHLVEGAQTRFTERQLKWDMGDFYLIGRIDRLDEHQNGLLEVVDYKSGRTSVEEEEIRNDLAMCIYAYLTSKCFPDRSVAATIYCLRSGEKATATFSDEELAEIEDGVIAIGTEIIQTNEDSDIEPEWIPYQCEYCDFLKLCARKSHWDVEQLVESQAD